MKRKLYLLIAIGLTISSVAMASMSTSKVRSETRFLSDKMAHELSLTTQQYNDIYEINYDFVNSIRNIMDDVVRGEEWAMDDYYEALDIRNDDLRWVLTNSQYSRFMGADYFYRPIFVNGGSWNFRIYINYPNRRLFYFGVPYHYHSYSGSHCRPHFHHVSFYRGRYPHGGHYPVPHRIRDERVFHSYRRSDFGSVHFRPNSSTRPHNAPTRPGVSGRPGNSNRPGGNTRPSIRPDRPESNRPESNRPVTLPETNQRPSRPDRPSRPSGQDRPNRPSQSDRPSRTERPSKDVRPSRTESSSRPSGSSRPSANSRPSISSRPSTNSRPSNGSSRSERGHVSSGSSERRSSSGTANGNSNSRSSSRSSERANGPRR